MTSKKLPLRLIPFLVVFTSCTYDYSEPYSQRSYRVRPAHAPTPYSYIVTADDNVIYDAYNISIRKSGGWVLPMGGPPPPFSVTPGEIGVNREFVFLDQPDVVPSRYRKILAATPYTWNWFGYKTRSEAAHAEIGRVAKKNGFVFIDFDAREANISEDQLRASLSTDQIPANLPLEADCFMDAAINVPKKQYSEADWEMHTITLNSRLTSAYNSEVIWRKNLTLTAFVVPRHFGGDLRRRMEDDVFRAYRDNFPVLASGEAR